MEVIPIEIDFNSCCRFCLNTGIKLISIFQENILNLISKHLPSILVCFDCAFSNFYDTNVTSSQVSKDDPLPKNICCACSDILKQFEGLLTLSIENDKKLQKLSLENSREEAKQIEDDLADAVNEIGLMLSDGNNLRSNFAANQGDDGSDKSLEIPGSLETDLAKDIDR